jgi:integrase
MGMPGPPSNKREVPMARVSKIGDSWYADYRYRGRSIRKVSKNARTQEEAEAALHQILANLFKEEYLGIKTLPKILFRDFLTEYLRYCKAKKRPSTYSRDLSIKRNLEKSFGNKYLTEISTREIEVYLERRMAKVSPASCNRELAFLKHLFRKAVDWGYLEVNPASRIRFFKEPPGRVRYLSDEERERLLNALSTAPPYLQVIVKLAMWTGMRLGEILSLRWRQIDFKNRLIHIENSKTHTRRSIPMTDEAYEALKFAYTKLPRRLDEDWVFINLETMTRLKSIKRSWKTLLKRAGIENFRFHDLRHDFASRLVMAGADLRTVQEVLGHRTLTMVMRYSHLSPKHLKKVFSSLEVWQKVDKNLIKGCGSS